MNQSNYPLENPEQTLDHIKNFNPSESYDDLKEEHCTQAKD